MLGGVPPLQAVGLLLDSCLAAPSVAPACFYSCRIPIRPATFSLCSLLLLLAEVSAVADMAGMYMTTHCAAFEQHCGT